MLDLDHDRLTEGATYEGLLRFTEPLRLDGCIVERPAATTHITESRSTTTPTTRRTDDRARRVVDGKSLAQYLLGRPIIEAAPAAEKSDLQRFIESITRKK